MKVIALVSGGKDSCFNMLLCKRYGHEVVALANLLPMSPDVDELDSYMFQTVGHQIISMYAECMGVPLFRRRIQGASVQQDLVYTKTERDEVEDMLQLLAFAKDRCPEIEAVSSGAIASDYQRQRVEHVCARLSLVSLSYMWHQPQRQLYRAMLDADIQAILIKVAAMGLQPPQHLGKDLKEMEPHLHKLARLYGCNVCGEGGEYETLVLDCPLFQHARIELNAWNTEHLSAGSVGAVAVLHPTQYKTQQKHTSRKPRVEPEMTMASSRETRQQSAPNKSSSQDEANQSVIWVPNDYQGCLKAPSTPESRKALSIKADVALQANACWLHASCTPRVLDKDSSQVASGDRVQRALHAALDAIQGALEPYGLGLADALFVHLYLARMEDFSATNKAYGRHFPAVNPPARACVETQLPLGVDLMVDVIVARDVGSRRVLHVQSISCWAPSCIGPYSQVAVAHGVAFFAGQIGLDPPSMQLVPGGPLAEAARCLASCQAVAVAVRCDLAQALLGCTIYAAASAGGLKSEQACAPGADHRCAGLDPAARLLEALLAGDSGGLSGATSWHNHGLSDAADSLGEPEGEVEEPAGASEENWRVDAYLQPPEMKRSWQPLVTYAVVSALPRGAAVEVQPVALSLCGQDLNIVQGLSEGLYNSTQPPPAESADLAEGSSQSAGHCEALLCTGRFCLCLLSVPQSATGDAASAGGLAAGGLHGALQEGHLSLHDVMAMRVYYCPALLHEETARGIVHVVIQGSSGADSLELVPVFVPVLAVGSTPAVQAALHIVMLAMRIHA